MSRVRARHVVLLIFGLYFLIPVVASIMFTLRGVNGSHTISTWTGLVSQPGFTSNLETSAWVAVATVALTLALMVPTMTWLHLRLPRWRRVVEIVCILPMAIPAVVVANGVLSAFSSWPGWFTGTPWILVFEYVVLALPFTFRSLDAGLGAIPLRTLVEAARSLGAGWLTVLWRVVVPNLRTAIASAAILCAAMVLGEFTLAQLLLLNTFPVWTVQAGQSSGEVATAASMLILLLSWALLMLMTTFGNRRKKPRRVRP